MQTNPFIYYEEPKNPKVFLDKGLSAFYKLGIKVNDLKDKSKKLTIELEEAEKEHELLWKKLQGLKKENF